ncbi:MAG: single-stranded DNA-binding protein [[Lactobacillus] timonensis]|jgi:single-strand DNA-binding protein|uniref:single-stranded DNA-binding protein n=1 Tax=[Lactobacillus] timonensis TaxID=1970790 RepID=UPI00235570B7|nr:single-stranded DNA-binding protein [[Lactobacillus] timonensis]MCI1925637.1 single-stranded DNA-binding protein [[Lactobacillus] timonensis]MCI1956998.1 single-stranded DNA-binding protein [[Lactobacillus] timonensis]MCI1970047.1 single-stranded DNA-binding protein [[Lactobacillus] timonensis]MCI2006188.1 single-stranded DNA-binding protein [[Lactobacillus] timonensis]
MSLNLCTFSGRLTDKPSGGSTNNGRSFARFSIAVRRNYKNSNGDYDADFINCVAFSGAADYLMKYGNKGDKVNVSGELHNNNWTDQNGNDRRDQQLTVRDIEIVAHPQRNQVSRQHYESQQQSYQNDQQSLQPPQGQQQAPQPQYEQQTMDTGNSWSNTSAGQKRQQQQANNQSVEINDSALPFNQGGQGNNANMTNEDDLPF